MKKMMLTVIAFFLLQYKLFAALDFSQQDKQKHFMYSSLISFSSNLALDKELNIKHNYLYSFYFTFGIGILKELRDRFDNNPNTHYEVNDMVADMLGCLSGNLTYYITDKMLIMPIITKTEQERNYKLELLKRF